MNEKDRFQLEVANLSKTHPFLAIEAATGCGKTKAVLMSIIQDISPKKWLVLVPEVLQMENLIKEIEKQELQWLRQNKIDNIICYASFKNFIGEDYNLWLNEAHKLSELKEDIANTINYDRIIVDSATIPKHVKDRLSTLGDFHYYKLPLQEAIDRKIVPEPVIYKIPIVLNDKINRNPAKYGERVYNITDKKLAEKHDKDLQYWKKRFAENPKEQWIGGKLNKIGGERKKFFSSCKTEMLQNLIKSLENKRFLCYTGSIEQCDELGGERAIHSKKTKKHNISTLESFNNLEINSIYMNKMGREGLNLEGIEAVIITQLGTGNDEGLEFLQKSGRGLRAISPEIYILYCKNTKDEDFLNKALSYINKEYVKEQII